MNDTRIEPVSSRPPCHLDRRERSQLTTRFSPCEISRYARNDKKTAIRQYASLRRFSSSYSQTDSSKKLTVCFLLVFISKYEGIHWAYPYLPIVRFAEQTRSLGSKPLATGASQIKTPLNDIDLVEWRVSGFSVLLETWVVLILQVTIGYK